MDVTDDEVRQWRDAILDDEWAPKYELDQLAKRDRDTFIAVTHRLLLDASPTVQRIALQKLKQHGDPEDAVAQASLLIEADDRSLLFEIESVLQISASSAAIAALFTLAERGRASAFRAVVRVARMPPDTLRAIGMACERVFSPDEAWRFATVAALHTYLAQRSWEEVTIEVARRFMDEGIFGLLGQWATPRVIPALQLLHQRIGSGWAESNDIIRAIERIRSRTEASEPPRSPSGSR